MDVGDLMKMLSLVLFITVGFTFFTSCAPVKFTKAGSQTVNAACVGAACNTSTNAIICDPKINASLTTFTYASLTTNYPSVNSNCAPSDVDYTWTVKKADSTVISSTIPGLSGANPTDVNMTVLGAGTYYVFLTATKTGSGLSSFVATNPIEFVVPGVGISSSLTCDPKLNATSTSVIVGANDSNPNVSANCVPAAATYLWTATRDGSPFVVSGLSGANSTPDFKSLGAGTYRLYLYATLTGSTHWESASPLVVTVAQTLPPVGGAIQCNPRINGSQTSLTLTGSSPNPLISANCLPSNVQYVWTVTKNGSNVNVPGLSGANSNPDFKSTGTGTYQISLQAAAPNYTSWNTTTPLIITVDDTTSNLTLNCAPRLNNTAVAVTVTTGGSNPLVTAGCSPTDVSYSWSVYKAGSAVTIGGLSGASSTGQFIQSGLGTYYIYLIATKPGYNAYVSPSPLEVSVATSNLNYRPVVYDKDVTPSDNKVDIILVVDDSNSMAPDNSKLAQRLQGFVAGLSSSGLDWQMCATVTRAQDSGGIPYWGLVRKWTGYIGNPQYVLNAGANNPYAIFTDTMTAIGAGWAGTDDERGIKAAWYNVEYKAYNTCYRPGASIATIMISDEDVRSVGGNASQVYYSGELKALEADDYPQNYVTKVKQDFGMDKRFTFNSIIVKPGDAGCMASQDAAGSKSHYGYKYQELSQMTGGGVTSICDTDYSAGLYYFKDRIINTMGSVPLECTPVGDVTVTVTPIITGLNTTIVNNTVVFNPAIPAGRHLKLEYKCSTM
jgi:hypothetical protein